MQIHQTVNECFRNPDRPGPHTTITRPVTHTCTTRQTRQRGSERKPALPVLYINLRHIDNINPLKDLDFVGPLIQETKRHTLGQDLTCNDSMTSKV